MAEATETMEFDSDKLDVIGAFAEIRTDVLDIMRKDLAVTVATLPTTQADRNASTLAPKEPVAILNLEADLPWKDYPKGPGGWIYSDLPKAKQLVELLQTAIHQTTPVDTIKVIMGNVTYDVFFSGNENKFITRRPAK